MHTSTENIYADVVSSEIRTTNAGSFRFVGDAADTLLFFPGLGFDSAVSFFLFSLLGLLSVIPLTWPPDLVLGLWFEICLDMGEESK